jgi:hypothetical protein
MTENTTPPVARSVGRGRRPVPLSARWRIGVPGWPAGSTEGAGHINIKSIISNLPICPKK